MTRSASSSRSERAASDLQAELGQYKHALREAGLTEATIYNYLVGSSRFVRWLAGEYAPGAGRPAFSARADPGFGLDLSERDAAIALAREQGATLQEIGTRFGISRERVRQILID